jgi:phosphoribosylpyrophosphate synthetase
LFFLGALRDASAGRVTAVIPYLCYARKDRKSKWRDPVTTRYIAALFEAVGVDSAVTLDVHNLGGISKCLADSNRPPRSKKAFCESLLAAH